MCDTIEYKQQYKFFYGREYIYHGCDLFTVHHLFFLLRIQDLVFPWFRDPSERIRFGVDRHVILLLGEDKRLVGQCSQILVREVGELVPVGSRLNAFLDYHILSVFGQDFILT